jgi:hypothetical protein
MPGANVGPERAVESLPGGNEGELRDQVALARAHFVDSPGAELSAADLGYNTLARRSVIKR